MKKYELTEYTIDVNGTTLYQIRYLKPFKKESVKVGDFGGFIESEENLSHEGDCLVLDDGIAMGNARVTMNGVIRHSSQVWGNALIKGDVELRNGCQVYGHTVLAGKVMIKDHARIDMHKLPDNSIHPAHIYEDVQVSGEAKIKGKAILFGSVSVFGEAHISGSPVISGITKIKDTVRITSEPTITGNVEISGDSKIQGKATIAGTVLIEDSAIRDMAVVTGKSSITGKSYLYDQSVVTDSIMKNGAQLHEKAKLQSSTLNGFVEMRHNAEIIDSDIEGTEILVMDDVKLEYVEMKRGFNIKFKDTSTLSHVLIHACKDFRTYDNAMVDGEENASRVIISGTTITITGDAQIGKDVVIAGDNVNIIEHASVTGKVRIGDDVGLYELAYIENRDMDNAYVLSNAKLSMDTKILIAR